MIKIILTSVLIISIVPFLSAQLTWADSVATIFYRNCTYCHNPSGIAPFSLLTYQDAYNYRLTISPSVANGIMPPWLADTTYKRYAHERVLTSTERNAILDWVAAGAPEGSSANTPPPPVYSNEGILTLTPDLELQIPTYTSKASATQDDYVCFVLPTGLTTDKKLRAFEIVPGNPALVHHALVYVDASTNYQADTVSGLCSGPTDGLVGGYTPGALPTVFPGQGNINFGYTIPAGSNIVLAMHYPYGTAGMQDSTKIRLYFYDDATPIREINSAPALQEWNFTIPADSITSVSTSFSNIPINLSLLSVFPHMHLLGKSIEAFGVAPSNDTIPLVRINRWDFHWQEFMFFRNIVKLPANTVLYGNAVYDNTTNNHDNPNNPPVDVTAGLNTTDEMFLVYFHFLPYQNGDENLDLDSLSQEFYALQIPENKVGSKVKVYPNPFKDKVNIQVDLKKTSTVSLYIYDISGKVIAKVADRALLPSGQQILTWDKTTTSGTKAGMGIYFYSLSVNGQNTSGRMVVVQ